MDVVNLSLSLSLCVQIASAIPAGHAPSAAASSCQVSLVKTRKEDVQTRGSQIGLLSQGLPCSSDLHSPSQQKLLPPEMPFVNVMWQLFADVSVSMATVYFENLLL